MKSVEVKNLRKIYETNRGRNQYVALKDVSFSINCGEFVAIMGESGSGKTTLLNILAGLDNSTSGSVIIDGKEISKMRDFELAKYRSRRLGFVFQDFNLLDILTVKENIYLPLILNKAQSSVMKKKMEELTVKLGIKEIVDKYPYEISGGQKQRTAIARAMAIEPEILLADEPTGALDSKAANNILDLFEMLNQEGQTILMVTHSVKAASRADRVLFIKDGELNYQIKSIRDIVNIIGDTFIIEGDVVLAENIFINKPYSYYYVMKYLNPEFDAWKPILDKNGRIISFEIGCFSEPCIFGVSFWSKSDAEIFKKIIADISTPENLSNSENFWDDYFNDFLDEIQIHTLEIPNYVASEMNNIIEYDMAITMCQKYYSNPKQYFINWHNNKNEYSYIMNTSQALSYTQKLLEEYIYKHPDENFSLTKPSYFENNEYPYIIQKEKKSIGFIDIAIEKNFFLLRRIYLDKILSKTTIRTQILENIITFSKLTNKELRVNVYDEEAEKFYKRLGFRKNFTNYVIRRQ